MWRHSPTSTRGLLPSTAIVQVCGYSLSFPGILSAGAMLQQQLKNRRNAGLQNRPNGLLPLMRDRQLRERENSVFVTERQACRWGRRTFRKPRTGSLVRFVQFVLWRIWGIPCGTSRNTFSP
jgi:hypothetical protein